MLWILFVALLVSACGKAKPEPHQENATAEVQGAFDAAAARLLRQHLKNGAYVYTLKPDGSLEHAGEAINEAAVAMASLKCADAEGIADAMADRIAAGQGAIARAEPLPETYKGREFNFDGETHLEYAFAAFAVRCPDQAGRLPEAWRAHAAMMADHGGEVYPGTGAKMQVGFAFLGKALSHRFGQGDEPPHGELLELEDAAAAWAGQLQIGHKPCWPVNLGFKHLRALEALGYDVGRGRDLLCAATRGMDIPTLDEWCGRGDLARWIAGYQYNRFEYRFQRCGEPWEQPDGHGDQTPAADLLEAIRQKYAVQN